MTNPNSQANNKDVFKKAAEVFYSKTRKEQEEQSDLRQSLLKDLEGKLTPAQILYASTDQLNQIKDKLLKTQTMTNEKNEPIDESGYSLKEQQEFGIGGGGLREWNEMDHPRDEDGKFTFKNGGVKNARNNNHSNEPLKGGVQKTRDKEIKKETQKEKQKSDPSKIFNKIQIGLGVFNDLLSNINKTRAESPTNEASLTHANSEIPSVSRGKNTQNHTDIANNTKRKKSANSPNIQKQTGKSFGAQKVALTGFEAPISNNDLKEIFKKNYAKQQNLNNIETDISDIDKANNINNDEQSKTNYIYVKSQQPIKDLYENTLNGIGRLFEPKKAKEKREQEAQQAHQEYLEQMGKIKDELKQIGIEYMKKQNPLYPLPPKGQWGKPTKNGSITSNYGDRFHPILKKIIFHEGIDIGVPIGTSVYAVADGKVKEAKWAKGYGNYVEIEHKTFKGETITSYYGHLENFSTKNGTRLKVGQTVKQGEQIALSGNTGRSTGAHLHFGMKIGKNQQDPTEYMGEVYKKVK